MVMALLGKTALLALTAIKQLDSRAAVIKTRISSRRKVARTAGSAVAQMAKTHRKALISPVALSPAVVINSAPTRNIAMRNLTSANANREWEARNAIGANPASGDCPKYLLDSKDVYLADALSLVLSEMTVNK